MDTKKSLIKILDKEKIGWWNYGKVSKVDIEVWDKKRKFAIKNFKDWEGVLNHSTDIYNILKKYKIDTWVTYRKIVGENSILMTLWNKDESYMFSSNNWSKDSQYLQKNPIEKINNLNDFYEQSYLNIKKLVDANLSAYFDSYIFKYKDNNLNSIVWDFDEIKEKKIELTDLISNNIAEFCYALLRSAKYFEMTNDLFRKFAYFLLDKQQKNDPFLKDIDLEQIYNYVDNLYEREEY